MFGKTRGPFPPKYRLSQQGILIIKISFIVRCSLVPVDLHVSIWMFRPGKSYVRNFHDCPLKVKFCMIFHPSTVVCVCQCTCHIITIIYNMNGRQIPLDTPLLFLLCVQADRSPCGSATTTRVAVQFAKGQIGLGQERISQAGLTGSCFVAKVHAQTTCGDFPAVVVEVSGKAHYIGSSVFTLEEDDEQKGGFNIRWRWYNLRCW